MQYKLTGVHEEEGGDTRASLRLECGRGCIIPLVKGAPRDPRPWGWDGNETAPTVIPSINCSKCGFHKTLTNGAWI